MKFGIFLATQWPEQASLEREFDNLAAQVRAAKDSGFSSVWVGQHVLTRPLQMVQTVPLMARLAGDGEGMTFGSCITLLGMMNPVMVAEEAASLDWITGGNFVLGVGIGYRKEEFEALNVPFEDRVGRFEEAIPLIRRLWSQDLVNHKGAHFTVDNLGASIQPVRGGSLPIWIGAQVPRAVRRAARMGDIWVPSPTPDYDVLENYFQIYREARSDAGLPLPEGQPLIRECFVGATREAALRTARGPLLKKYQSYASWGEDGSAGGGSLADGFDDFMANRFIVADEAEAADEFTRYGKQFGVEHMILRMQWPGLPQSDVIDCIERIGRIAARMG